ncbi:MULTISPECIES: DUF4159 domain-containing protein [unclassified Saccharibacter]|uniref:DUF4159 domain-containing protein n=1 Tax=unclassified Saccharibacter TaxID=2648722 RepID=UPI0013284590|nr:MULTISPECIES: DUF4159 domain-containing protein [unclassified Saccharibacter]MXV35039.1 DUF4159 domain-containing protein [Saccharibacter sp. EH611]MXV57414.1 DUF4159 domain-containing protein [Saccharibacter sp. EH70]MXV64725.1 DUF4159 domain-containing protein [Saccharibacter sp. EH60]
MSFLTPALLFFLLLLPGLIWLVKATPPQPREKRFSSLLLLRQLAPKRQDSARTPLWLLLLRMAALILVIVTFSQPLWLRKQAQPSPSSLVIVLDNGWASMPHWEERRTTAQILGDKTLQAGGSVTVLLTAHDPGGPFPESVHPRDHLALERYLRKIQARPWPVDRSALAQQLNSAALHQELAHSSLVILSDGLAQDSDNALQKAIQDAHDVRDIRWERCDLIRLNRAPSHQHAPSILAETLPHCPSHSLSLHGLTVNEQGQVSTLAHWTAQTGTPSALTLPAALATSLDAVSAPAVPPPAGTFLFNGGQHQHPVGILHLGGDNAPLTGTAFYLTEAMSKQGAVRSGDLKSLLTSPLSIVMAPDGTLTDPDTQHDALTWVQKGGVLVRFAGTDLAHRDESSFSDTDRALLPVPLLHGMRQLGGPMSWGSPQGLANFPIHSPFAGLTTPKEVTVTRQVLAQPTNDLQEHVWATLTDGTPLVTARREGRGMVVLFHTTPTADWSTLPLSGLFPQMLERLVTNAPSLAQSDHRVLARNTDLPAWKILTAQGTLGPADTSTRPLNSKNRHVDATHPVGLYGPAEQLQPLNLADDASPLRDEPVLGTLQNPDFVTPDWPLWPILSVLALVFFGVDILCSLGRQGFLPLFRVAVVVGGVSFAGNAAFSAPSDTVPAGALDIHLAYVVTGDAPTDEATRQGLEGLTHFVNHRSTAHLGAPIGVTLGHDDLAFYPLIYWPILPNAQPSPAQNAALNDYIHHGGLLLLDEMGAGSILDNSNGDATRRAIKRVTEELDIPPLTPIDDTHTLSHAFYLLHDYPGRVSGQPVYVARFGDDNGENVSPVIIGNGDWAHAWAIDQQGHPPFAVVPDGESQRTLAYRFGFNAVIYALTGNYKNDQRHYPEMLHRLKNTQDDTQQPTGEEGP